MKQVAIILIAVVFGAGSYWLLSPLIIDIEVQDELDATLQARLEVQRKVDEARARAEQNSTTNESSVATEEQPEAVEPSVAELFGIKTSGPFPIVSTPGHPASGQVEVIQSPEEKLIYFKDYDGTNGPDLKIYLAKDLDANEFYDLGDAKGNRGNLIYGVPLNVDLNEYTYVLTWCEAFGVLFDYAEIN